MSHRDPGRPDGCAMRSHTRPVLLGLILGLCIAASGAGAAQAALPPIHHVYVIVLENESASTTFGPGSPAPYLSNTLRAQGAYLPKYYGIGHVSLDNYIAMISGQAPNTQTQTDCQFFTDFVGMTTVAHGQLAGTGCVFPTSLPTPCQTATISLPGGTGRRVSVSASANGGSQSVTLHY
jgi:hypothetical protein